MDKMNKDDKAILRSAQAPSKRAGTGSCASSASATAAPWNWSGSRTPACRTASCSPWHRRVRLEPGGPLRQFKNRMDQVRPARGGVIPLIKEAVENWVPQATPEEVGTVVAVGDEIATVTGLKNASYGEILLFPSGVKGMVQELRRDEIGCMLFGDGDEIVEGSIVHRSGKTAGIPVGDDFLGRVINALASPSTARGRSPLPSTAPSRRRPPPSSTGSL